MRVDDLKETKTNKNFLFYWKMMKWCSGLPRQYVCVSVRSPGPALNAACQLAQWMPQPPLPAPSLLPSGHSSGHAHGCYSSAWLNASVPQNKGAECPLKIHPVHSLPTRRPFSGSSPPESKTKTLWTPFFFSGKVTKKTKIDFPE